MADTSVIETIDLHKRYGGTTALRGLTLGVPRGSIFGCLGRNGAGKTTTIKVLLGMVRPDSGTARVFDRPVTDADASVDIRRRSAFVSEEKDLYDYMTVEEIVRFTAAFYPRWRHDLEDRYIRTFELVPTQRIRTLSRGTRTKLALLLALCRGAELLILDEPTSGLDPAAAENVLQRLVSHVAREEATVFFSSHQIVEVDQIADHVAIVDRGRTIVAGPLDELRENYRRVQLVFAGDAPDAALRARGIERVRRDGRVLTVWGSAGAEPILEAARALNPVSADVAPVTLKEIFLETVRTED